MVHTDYVEGDTVFTSSPLFSDGDYKDNSFSRTNSIDSSLTSETKDFLLLTKTKSTISHYGSIAATALIETDEKENSSTLGASLNLFNAIMGTGIIGLPLALHLCGFWTGLFFAVSIGYLTCMAMHITILCGLHTKTVSLPGLCGSMLGHVGSHIINFIIFFHTAGTAVSYYMLLGDTLPSLLALAFPSIEIASNRKFVIIMFGIFCTLPLSLSRSTARFAKWSAVTVILLTFMLAGVLIRVPVYAPPLSQIELETVPISENMFKGMAIMGLSFGCSQNLFGEYTSTRDKRPNSWLLTCSVAIFMSFIANIIFAVLCYLCFGSNVQANILLNFPESDPAIRLVRLALGLFMVLTIPLSIHPCREAVLLMFGHDKHSCSNKTHYMVTLGIFAVVLYFSATLTSLGKVFNVIGGFSTTVLGLLLPGSTYIYLFSADLFKGKCSGGATWHLLIVSIIVVILSMPIIFFSVKDIFT